jgi:hypothetical protein
MTALDVEVRCTDDFVRNALCMEANYNGIHQRVHGLLGYGIFGGIKSRKALRTYLKLVHSFAEKSRDITGHTKSYVEEFSRRKGIPLPEIISHRESGIGDIANAIIRRERESRPRHPNLISVFPDDTPVQARREDYGISYYLLVDGGHFCFFPNGTERPSARAVWSRRDHGF